MKNLIIGVVARPDTLSSKTEAFVINKKINDAVVKNGAQVIAILPPITEELINKNIETTNKLTQGQFEKIKQVINLCDGIICPGGDDFYDYDLKIIEYCHNINKPLLGICLGMQTMSCLFNGHMKDLEYQNHKSDARYVHMVKIKRDSKLYEILNKEIIEVNSRHKSYIESTDLNITGMSEDNIIEAVEDKNKKFFIGVQWHPESMIEYDITENNIFSNFINSCRG